MTDTDRPAPDPLASLRDRMRASAARTFPLRPHDRAALPSQEDARPRHPRTLGCCPAPEPSTEPLSTGVPVTGSDGSAVGYVPLAVTHDDPGDEPDDGSPFRPQWAPQLVTDVVKATLLRELAELVHRPRVDPFARGYEAGFARALLSLGIDEAASPERASLHRPDDATDQPADPVGAVPRACMRHAGWLGPAQLLCGRKAGHDGEHVALVSRPDVAAFIRARLDEHEETALIALGATAASVAQRHVDRQPPVGSFPVPRWSPDGMRVRQADSIGTILIVGHTWPNEAAHIALNDPVHVLAWVAALRRVLALTECHACQIEQQPCDHRDDTHRALAAAWREHPDYRTEWEA